MNHTDWAAMRLNEAVRVRTSRQWSSLPPGSAGPNGEHSLHFHSASKAECEIETTQHSVLPLDQYQQVPVESWASTQPTLTQQNEVLEGRFTWHLDLPSPCHGTNRAKQGAKIPPHPTATRWWCELFSLHFASTWFSGVQRRDKLIPPGGAKEMVKGSAPILLGKCH